MNLYVWYNIEALRQNDPGKIFVLAENKSQATNEAVKEYREQNSHRTLSEYESVETLERELNDKDPIVIIDELAVFIEYGSA